MADTLGSGINQRPDAYSSNSTDGYLFPPAYQDASKNTGVGNLDDPTSPIKSILNNLGYSQNIGSPLYGYLNNQAFNRGFGSLYEFLNPQDLYGSGTPGFISGLASSFTAPGGAQGTYQNAKGDIGALLGNLVTAIQSGNLPQAFLNAEKNGQSPDDTMRQIFGALEAASSVSGGSLVQSWLHSILSQAYSNYQGLSNDVRSAAGFDPLGWLRSSGVLGQLGV